MPIDTDSEDGRIIRQFFPISRLPLNSFASLCKNINIETAKAGSYLFKCGEELADLIYLIEGTVNLQTEEFQVEPIKSGTNAAFFALAHHNPRKIDAYTETDIRFLRLNADMIKSLQEQQNDNSPPMKVDDVDDNNDWMTTFLKSPIFRALPPANLQRILMELEAVDYEKGDKIITQGDQGDYFYLIKSGKCLVNRKATASARPIKLGELNPLETFGEDALLSGEPRNVSVSAITDCSLLRLNKESFIALVKNPSLKFVSFEQLVEQTAKGAAIMDIRSPDEFQEKHLPGSVNIPFFSLRMHLKTLDKNRTVIVVCHKGNLGEAAAFLLLRNKVNAFVLSGGIDKAPADKLTTGTPNFTETKPEAPHSQPAHFEIDDQQPLSEPQLSEVEKLQQTVRSLEDKCIKLTLEKEEIGKKYMLLLKKSEQLKTILNDLRKNNPET